MKSRNTEPLDAKQAYQYALRLLTGRDYSAAKIRVKLTAREVGEQNIEGVILQLQKEGWLDDRRYASRFAESALSSGSDEVAEVRSATARRYPEFKFSAATDRDKRRVISFLQRRGFGISSILQALRTEEGAY